MRRYLGAAVLTAAAAMAGAQSGTVGGTTPHPVDRQTEAQLAEQGKATLALAEKSPQGIGSIQLVKYPAMFTMLTARTRSGGAELHANWDDVFVVIDGEATLLSGGTIVDRKEQADGEARGTRVEGGTPTQMRKGDVIHVSAGVPHQTTLEAGKTFTYYVIKVAVKK